MKTLIDIKKEYQTKNEQLFKDCGVFWAFSTEQFHENKTPLQEGEKYVSIGAGGYMPKSKVEQLRKGMAELKKEERAEVRKSKLWYQEISYELNNHECYYTGNISPVVEMFSGTYTEKKIREVFNAERANHLND